MVTKAGVGPWTLDLSDSVLCDKTHGSRFCDINRRLSPQQNVILNSGEAGVKDRK